jgi:hypothetical protein
MQHDEEETGKVGRWNVDSIELKVYCEMHENASESTS